MSKNREGRKACIRYEAAYYDEERSRLVVDWFFQRPAYQIQRFLKHLRYINSSLIL